MNLFDLAQRKDRNLVLTDRIASGKVTRGDGTWRGFVLTPDAAPQLRLRGVPGWFPFVERPDDVGWRGHRHRGPLAVFGRDHARLAMWFESAGQRIGDGQTFDLGDEPVNLTVPWPSGLVAMPPDAELVMHVSADSPAKAFVAIHRAMDRTGLIQQARGRGVEIGPGANPQLRPGPDRQVTYVEQMSAEEWETLYNGKGKYDFDPSLWQHYRRGEAHDLPVDDDSLDFIFSSHVFEHLSNPLGHLQAWHRKLKPGGVVLAVVPDVCGAKDYRFRPCSMDEFRSERERGGFAPELRHYQRWVTRKHLATAAEELMQSRWSIHVHFYTRRNIVELLHAAVAELGFAAFDVQHHANHKDFHFALRK